MYLILSSEVILGEYWAVPLQGLIESGCCLVLVLTGLAVWIIAGIISWFKRRRMQ